MQVRAARPTDILGIAEVHVRSWQETYVGQVPQDYLDTLSVEDRYERWQELVAGADQPVGCLRWRLSGVVPLHRIVYRRSAPKSAGPPTRAVGPGARAAILCTPRSFR